MAENREGDDTFREPRSIRPQKRHSVGQKDFWMEPPNKMQHINQHDEGDDEETEAVRNILRIMLDSAPRCPRFPLRLEELDVWDESEDELRTLEPNNFLVHEREETEAAAAAIQTQTQGKLILDPIPDAEIHQMEKDIEQMISQLNRSELFKLTTDASSVSDAHKSDSITGAVTDLGEDEEDNDLLRKIYADMDKQPTT